MSGRTRLLLAVLVAIVLIAGTTVTFAAVAVLHDGSIAVDVQDADGTHFALAVPTSLVRTALALAPMVEHPEMDLALAELRPHWPLVREVAEQLGDLPDGVFVEVNGGDGEHVVVAKENGDLVVRVQDGGDRVHVRVPAAAVQDAVDAVGRLTHLD